jgi:hypothetical protein
MSDEPRKRSRAWVWWTALALYPLSMGPAAWWAGPSNDRWQTVDTVYSPLDWLETHFKPFVNAMGWYLDKLHDLRR